MKHSLLVPLLFAASALFTTHQAYAEDVLLHVYTQVPGAPQGWALMPVLADLPDTSPASLFDALRRKKLPTYGTSSIDAHANVALDASKCAYAAIITTELSRTFEENNQKLGQIVCAGNVLTPDPSALAATVQTIPMWLALAEVVLPNRVSSQTWVDTGDELVRYTAFRQKALSGDKKMLKLIEAAFDAPCEFVQRQTMSAVITAGVPGSEPLIAKRLSDKKLSTRASAMRALKSTSNVKLIAQMREAIDKASLEDKLVLAEAALGSSDVQLNKTAALVLLASTNEDLFTRALAALAPADIASKLSDLLNAATPSHAARIAMTQAQTDQTALRAWLNASDATPAAIAIADACLAQPAFTRETKSASHAIYLLSDDFDRAEQSYYALTGRTLFDTVTPVSLEPDTFAAMERAENAKDAIVRWASRDATRGDVIPAEDYDVVAAQKRAFDTDVRKRAQVAAELVSVDSSADAVRSALLKDSDPHVVQTMINALAFSHATRFARELTNLAKTQDEETRRVILRALPDMIDAENANAVTAFISNELFDPSLNIRIASMYALAQIARRTNDPVIADNAITSISMTVQDKDSRVQWHTLLALAETQMGSAKALIQSSTHTQAAQIALSRIK